MSAACYKRAGGDSAAVSSDTFRNNTMDKRDIDFPFHFDSRGRTALLSGVPGSQGADEHIRDLLEQLIFTNPGERVNRPDFGSGILQLVFAPNSPELAATLQFTLQAAIQRELSDLIELNAVDVEAVDSTLTIDVKYTVHRTGQPASATFTQPTT